MTIQLPEYLTTSLLESDNPLLKLESLNQFRLDQLRRKQRDKRKKHWTNLLYRASGIVCLLLLQICNLMFDVS